MANIFDYMMWRGDLTMDESPFNEIDNLMLSQLSFIDFTEVVSRYPETELVTLEEAMKDYSTVNNVKKVKMGLIVPNDIVQMAVKMGKLARYKDLKIGAFVNDINLEQEKQFSALTIYLDKDTVFYSFRGTDDTLVGWKENLNMVFCFPTESEASAKVYVDTMTQKLKPASIYLGGHSKGGNLALYSGIYAEDYVIKKIKKIYNNDGPGLERSLVDPEKCERVEKKIHTIAPEGSVIGMLFDHFGEYEIVKSSYHGLFQHDGFSWQLVGKNFVDCATRSKESLSIEKEIRALIDSMTKEEKYKFVEGIYTVLQANNAKTLTELFNNKDKYKLLTAYLKLDPESKKICGKALMILFKNKAIVKK